MKQIKPSLHDSHFRDVLLELYLWWQLLGVLHWVVRLLTKHPLIGNIFCGSSNVSVLWIALFIDGPIQSMASEIILLTWSSILFSLCFFPHIKRFLNLVNRSIDRIIQLSISYIFRLPISKNNKIVSGWFYNYSILQLVVFLEKTRPPMICHLILEELRRNSGETLRITSNNDYPVNKYKVFVFVDVDNQSY